MKTTTAAIVAAGQAVAGPCTVYSVTVLSDAVGASVIEIRDGGVAGEIRGYLGAPVSEAGGLTWRGMGFITDVWITGVNIEGVTVEYMPD